MNDYFDLGEHSYPISTQSMQAQTWFDRGLLWCYGFNQEEAIRCFEQVLNHDPGCAMAYWGIAYAYGPFYNKPWKWFGEQERFQTLKQCHTNSQKALALSARVTPPEQQLIKALCLKFPTHQPLNLEALEQAEINYAFSMRELLENFADDLDINCLTVEALVNLTPWKLWDIQLKKPTTDAHTLEVIEILERAMALDRQQAAKPHAGLLHYYIHAVEMSPDPDKAIDAANQLRRLSPESGHLLHMATHIDVLLGHYDDALKANNCAIASDQKYIGLRGNQEFYMISCLHNFHSKMYAAMFLGQFKAALEAAEAVHALVSDEVLKMDARYLTSTIEAYYSAKTHVLVRFGRWQEIIDEDLPENTDLYPLTTTLLYYAKTIANAAIGEIATARHCQAEFARLQDAIPDWHIIANNPTRDVLAVAEAMLNGELEYHAGNAEQGFSYLRQAILLCDQLAYCEPWPWMHPPRHALGALLLEQGQIEEAMLHFCDDLGIGDRLARCLQHRNNIWALHGYSECLNRLNRVEELQQVQQELDAAGLLTDINITSSCCCRKNTR